MATTDGASMGWLWFAFMTVAAWGCYGVFLHQGNMAIGDPINGRYKAFLWVGIAYFLTAVLAPAALLWLNGGGFAVSPKGAIWSLVAGVVGAIGAFGVLLAFGSGGTPAVVMSIVFGCAPIVNAFVAMSFHPPAGGLDAIRWPFLLGIAMAGTGAWLVTMFKPV